MREFLGFLGVVYLSAYLMAGFYGFIAGWTNEPCRLPHKWHYLLPSHDLSCEFIKWMNE